MAVVPQFFINLLHLCCSGHKYEQLVHNWIWIVTKLTRNCSLDRYYIERHVTMLFLADCVWNVMAHEQKPDFVFRRNGRVHSNRRGFQFSRLLAAEVCASAVVMLDRPCSKVVWRLLATHSLRQFPLHFLSRASSCAIMFQLGSNSFPGSGSSYTQMPV